MKAWEIGSFIGTFFALVIGVLIRLDLGKVSVFADGFFAPFIHKGLEEALLGIWTREFFLALWFLYFLSLYFVIGMILGYLIGEVTWKYHKSRSHR